MVSGHASMPVSGGRTQTTAPVAGHSGRGGVVLLSFPTDDTLFQRLADRQVRAVREGATQLRAARRHLRTRYPKADLNRQQAVIVRGRQIEFWFAHRDGHPEPSIPDYSWWQQRGTARAIVQSGGRLTHPNRACQSLLRMPRSGARLALARDFLPTDLCDELTAGATWLPEVREGASTSVLRRAGEPDRQVEFHAEWEGAGRGRHRIWLRSVAERDASRAEHALRTSSLGELPERQRRDLLRAATPRELAAGERLRESVIGDPWIALVLSGVVRVYVMTEDLDATVQYGRHGSLLGSPWMSAPDVAVGLQALTPAKLLLIDPARIDRQAETDVAFTRAVSAETRSQLRDLIVAYAARSSAKLDRRLAREILLLAEMEHSLPLVPVTEQQLADGVGSLRESVARAIAGLRRRGWLATTRYGIIVLDAVALRRAADAHSLPDTGRRQTVHPA
jgi:CRP/FNR family cyclic AMP-dependent transcriptional regulator